MKRIILDTNFLLIPYNFKVDIYEEIKRIVHDECLICIIDRTRYELDKILNTQKGKDKAAAKFALDLIDKKKPESIITENQHVDESILLLAEQEDCIVATQDKELKDKLKQLKRKIIVLRQKNHLEIA